MRWASRVLIWMSLGLTACSAPSVLERLDERAGMTLRYSAAPLVFARTDPRYSRSARDYLYLAPLETNRQGVREYFLWIGVATTIDRGFLAPALERPDALYVTIDGEPMELPLRPIDALVRRSSEKPVYATAVPLQAELAARVSLQQLRLLAAADLESLSAARQQAPPQTYVRWGQPIEPLDDFLSVVDR